MILFLGRVYVNVAHFFVCYTEVPFCIIISKFLLYQYKATH
jgi:hypothetical protein